MPPFCLEFLRGIEQRTSVLTRLGYLRDLKMFFEYLINNTKEFCGKRLSELTISDLNNVTQTHIEMFLSYLRMYKNKNSYVKNGECSVSRKLSSIRSLLKYFYKKNSIDNNVASKVDTPKLHEKPITRLEVDEVVKILNLSEDGYSLTQMQQGFHKHTKERDYAILSLFLGTGIRISECVGLNVEDIDFTQNAFNITRKGGSKVTLYFNNEVADALLQYLDVRSKIKNLPEGENALFLSLQNKRINVRTVQILVKKYAQIINPLKKITPHKLRSTFGTNLYRETNDIYVVASVLGHKDINVTRKHYAAITDDIKRDALTRNVKLRED
ncbi:MAG: integrase [Clostridiales bacterium]|nr:integrase [Clostridiales bacterium]